jgi:hypothetical protein
VEGSAAGSIQERIHGDEGFSGAGFAAEYSIPWQTAMETPRQEDRAVTRLEVRKAATICALHTYVEWVLSAESSQGRRGRLQIGCRMKSCPTSGCLPPGVACLSLGRAGAAHDWPYVYDLFAAGYVVAVEAVRAHVEICAVDLKALA